MKDSLNTGFKVLFFVMITVMVLSAISALVIMVHSWDLLDALALTITFAMIGCVAVVIAYLRQKVSWSGNVVRDETVVTPKNYLLSVVPIAFLLCVVATQFTYAHNGGVNANGCHVPGGADSGNPCHCHPDGKRSPDLPCLDGMPVAGEEDEDEGEVENTIEYYKDVLVAPEEECTDYERDDYTYGSKLDVIQARRLGGYYAIYEDTCYDVPEDVHIEHMVALKEAHDSGLCSADEQTKIQFANDLDNIVLASPTVNLEKSASDAADWLPVNHSCWFAAQVLKVKSRYQLTIDEAERDALKEILDTCSFNDVDLPVDDTCTLPTADEEAE